MPEREIKEEQVSGIVEMITSQGGRQIGEEGIVPGTGNWLLDGQIIEISSPDAPKIQREINLFRRMSRASGTHLMAAMKRAQLIVHYEDSIAEQMEKVLSAEIQEDAQTS